MRTEYRRENHKNLLVILPDPKSTEDEAVGFAMRMLSENRLEQLLELELSDFNGKKEMAYDITSRQPLDILYEKQPMDRTDIRRLLQSVLKAGNELEQYLLDEDGLVLETAYIYGGKKGDYRFIYDVEVSLDHDVQVESFLAFLLEHADKEDSEAVMDAFGFYQRVRETGGDLVRAIRDLFDSKDLSPDESAKDCSKEEAWETGTDEFYLLEEETAGAEPAKRSVCREGRIAWLLFFGVLFAGGAGLLIYTIVHFSIRSLAELLSYSGSVAGIAVTIFSALGIAGLLLVSGRREEKNGEEPKPAQTEYGRTVSEEGNTCEPYEEEEPVLSNDTGPDAEEERTVLLDENCYREQRILRGRIRGRQREIDLSAFPFIIGKNREQSDYVIEDNSISRIHARFTERDGSVFITDLNSLNGTFLNGIRLIPQEMRMLEAGDEVTMGRLNFTYS